MPFLLVFSKLNVPNTALFTFLLQVAPSKEIPASPNKKRQANCSSKLLTRASKLLVSPSNRMISVPLRNGINSAAECERTAGDLVEKKRLTVKSLHMSVNFASGTGKTSKTNSVFQEVGSARSDENLFDTSQDSSTPLRTSTRVFTSITCICLIYLPFTFFHLYTHAHKCTHLSVIFTRKDLLT